MPDASAASWTDAYLRVRAREGRLYDDATVARLPDVPPADPWHGEWRQRAGSADRLLGSLARRAVPPVILEVGCGNGWLAHRLAALPGSRVTGLDVNEMELAQARRVFGAVPGLRFVAGDVLTCPAPAPAPDVIVLASVIQYVPDLVVLLARLTGWLAPGGEIDLLDSPLYEPAEVGAARARTVRHYTTMGTPTLAAAYHHHVWGELAGLPVEVVYRPEALRHRLASRLLGWPRSPFPWLSIRPATPRSGR